MAEKKATKKATKVISKKAGPKKMTEQKIAQSKPSSKKRQVVNPPKNPRGKKYQKIVKDIDVSLKYPLAEAAELVLKSNTTKFKSAVEMHIHLSSDFRGSVQLPKSTGKKIIVAEANDQTIAELEKGDIKFDVLLATPAQMPKIAKFARTLGPKGLMPNPKSGTVTEDIATAKKELEAGKAEFRTDEGKNIHLVVGQANSKAEDIVANVQACTEVLPPNHIKSITLATTMGPGIKVLGVDK